MPTTSRRRQGSRPPTRHPSDAAGPLPMVEIVLSGVNTDDWVTDSFRSMGVSFRLLACRPADRGRRRLLRLFEVQTDGEGLGPILRRLRTHLSSREMVVSSFGPDRALVRISAPMPPSCSAAFELGDFCINCPFLSKAEGQAPVTWKVLVPEIGDARRLLRASATRTDPRPVLLRAGAYRRPWGLTGRQERALRTAFQLGYFDYPRKASLAELSGRLGIGRSTTLELLRKAVTKLAAQWFLAEPPVDRLL